MVDQAAPSNRSKRTGPIFRYGLFSGFLLVILGGAAIGLAWINFLLAVLVVCIGLGLIAGALGSTASLSLPIQGATVGGGAAIGAVFFFILIAEITNRYVLVTVSGDVKEATVDLIGDKKYFGGYREDVRAYDFVVFGKEIKRRNLRLEVIMDDETEYIFECLDADKLRPFLASGQTVEWAFKLPNGQEDKPRIIDADGDVIVPDIGHCNALKRVVGVSRADLNQTAIADPSLTLIGSAEAQESSADAVQLDTETYGQINDSLEKLQSSISRVRRSARSDLARYGLPVVPPLLAELSRDDPSYRTRLGVVVALAEMMRENKQDRAEIITRIDSDQVRFLVDAAADQDRTIRVYASEFLYDLGDPRSIDVTLTQAWQYPPEGRYSALFAMMGAIPFATQEQKQAIADSLPNLKSDNTPRTNALIEEIVSKVEG